MLIGSTTYSVSLLSPLVTGLDAVQNKLPAQRAGTLKAKK
jgi:hypothetical protein